jgi:radical SAM superfamily enzyme YgiQ (UPF0313 family)
VKILLVLPASEGLRVTARDPRVPRRAMLRFSILPLTTVAALTPPGHEVSVCDENVEPLDLNADVDLVGVSYMTALAPRAREIAAAFRARGRLAVAGGYHPTLCPEDAARHFDAVCVGDAEELWPRIVRDAAAGRLRRFYRHECPPDLAATPVPRRDLAERTARHYATRYAVQVGRGCRHGCRYCSVTAFHRRTYRARPLADVLAELGGVPRDFIFVDDNIIADPEYARRLFRAMLPMKKRWVSQCSLKIADDPELLDLARAAGCRGLFVGIETTSARNLAAVGKSFNDSSAYMRRIREIRRRGIGIIAGMIVGMDADGPEVFERTLRFLGAARIDALQLNILTPLPGTPLHEEFRRAGRIADRDLAHYDFRHCVIRPAGMTAAELQDGADWLYRQFYRLDRIALRALRALAAGGPVLALLSLRLNLTYRYDNVRERVAGRNPARPARRGLLGRLSDLLGGRRRAAPAPDLRTLAEADR